MSKEKIRSLIGKHVEVAVDHDKVEKANTTLDKDLLKRLTIEAWKRSLVQPVCLLRTGARFAPPSNNPELDLF